MEISCRCYVLESNDIVVGKIPERFIRIVFGLIPGWKHEPMVVVVLVVITSHLLLCGTDWVRLNVRVEQTTTPAHVFERDFGTVRNL